MSEDISSVSDGYHTFDELYEHRHLLFLNLMRMHRAAAWIAEAHEDGSEIDGWFVAGIELPTGQITYHLPDDLWEMARRCSARTHERAPWDGHTANDVLTRLRALIG